MLICAVTDDLTKRYNAARLLRDVRDRGGKGGGRPDMAQAVAVTLKNLPRP
jgi:alanyl-tRNA synthetase